MFPLISFIIFGDFRENSDVFFLFSELKKCQIFLLKSGGFHTVSNALKSWDCEILSFSQVFHHFMMGAPEIPGRFPEIHEIYLEFQMLPS